MSRETAQQIDVAAAQWAARADRGLTKVEERALDAWLAGDARRLGAYGRMRAVALYSERAQALGPTYDRAQFKVRPESPTSDRRRLLFTAGGALAASVAGVAFVGSGLMRRGERYSTRVGELTVVPLADGSVMTLNTATVAQVRFTTESRLIRLIEGEALFDVAEDVARPFIVEARGTIVRAVGTSFRVLSLGENPVEVLVREGVVDLERGSRRMRLRANRRAVVSRERERLVASEVPPAEVGRELAWREGRLVFAGESLSVAAERFGRYSTTRIVIEDPTVAAQPITGLFMANDPVGFAQAIASSLDLHARITEGEVRLTH